jgi:hypothetical protein
MEFFTGGSSIYSLARLGITNWEWEILGAVTGILSGEMALDDRHFEGQVLNQDAHFLVSPSILFL